MWKVHQSYTILCTACSYSGSVDLTGSEMVFQTLGEAALCTVQLPMTWLVQNESSRTTIRHCRECVLWMISALLCLCPCSRCGTVFSCLSVCLHASVHVQAEAFPTGLLLQDVCNSWKSGIWNCSWNPGNIGNLLEFSWCSWKIFVV